MGGYPGRRPSSNTRADPNEADRRVTPRPTATTVSSGIRERLDPRHLDAHVEVVPVGRRPPIHVAATCPRRHGPTPRSYGNPRRADRWWGRRRATPFPVGTSIPGRARPRSGQAGARRWGVFDVPTHVAGRQPDRAETGDGRTSEVLTDASPLLENLQEWRRDRRQPGLAREVPVEAGAQVDHGVDARWIGSGRLGRVLSGRR
jgi:hypothetical protein